MKIIKPITQAVLVSGLVFFGYWAIVDYMHLIQAMELLTDSREEMSERDFQYYVAVEKTHRLNVGFEGTWFLLTLIALIQVSKDK